MDELIKEYHKLYAQYGRSEYLEIAATLGIVQLLSFEEVWARRVNEGCITSGIPKIYSDK